MPATPMSSSLLYRPLHRPIKSLIRVTVCLLSLAMSPLCLAEPEGLSLEQVLQQVLDTYPSLRIAALQVERARLESARAAGQLSWTLGA